VAKGKAQFTASEADQIRALLSQKMQADRSGQKDIRRRLRQLQFYISDFSQSNNPFTSSDFSDLIRKGTITLSK
jgi:hypothetical protein